MWLLLYIYVDPVPNGKEQPEPIPLGPFWRSFGVPWDPFGVPWGPLGIPLGSFGILLAAEDSENQ